MFEEYKITKELRKLKDTSGRTKFLNVLRVKLEEHIDKNPVNEIKKPRLSDIAKRGGGNPLFFLQPAFNKFKTVPGLAVIVLAVLVSCIGGVAIASQSSLPGEPLYTVKAFTENVRYSLAFSPESRARINMEFAGDRISEIKRTFEKKGVDSEGFDIALSRLNDNAQSTAEIIQKEKESGRDVSELAKNTHDTIKQFQEDLKQTFEEQKNSLKTQRDELMIKIEEAKKTNNASDKDALDRQLLKIESYKKLLEAKKEESEKIIERQKENIKKGLDAEEKRNETKKEAEEEINELIKEKAEMAGDAIKNNIEIPGELSANFDAWIAKAKEAFGKEDYSLMERNLEEAKNILEKIKDLTEKIGAKEPEDDNDKDDDKQDGHINKNNESREGHASSSSSYEYASSYYERDKEAKKEKNKKDGDQERED